MPTVTKISELIRMLTSTERVLGDVEVDMVIRFPLKNRPDAVILGGEAYELMADVLEAMEDQGIMGCGDPDCPNCGGDTKADEAEFIN